MKVNTRFRVSLSHGLLLLLWLHNVHSSSPSCCQICQCRTNEVWCDQKNLVSIPSGIPITTKRLYLFNNNISVIPVGVFSRLESLEMLDLRSNAITNDAFQPGVLDGLKNLKDLLLTENKLTALRKNIFSGNGNLARLYLKKNKIESIDDVALANLTHLVELKLSNNRLTSIPKFVNCPSLRRLGLNNNRLRHLQTGVFSQINLEELMLSNNQLRQVPSTIFGETSNLRILDISENKLRSPPRIIRNMTSMKTLNLSGNAIASLPEDFLSNMRKLKVLDLKGMLLTTLPRNFIPRRVYLNVLDISGNPWSCDCDVQWMIEYMKMFQGIFESIQQIQCRQPLHLRGRQLAQLNDDDNYCEIAAMSSTTTSSPQPQRTPVKNSPVDLCDALACTNGATCSLSSTTYMPECRCSPGWKGLLCEEMIASPPTPGRIPSTSSTSTSETSKPKLMILNDSLTAHSVAIVLPAKKRVTLFTTPIPSNGEGNGLTSKVVISPNEYSYTVTGLESGTRYRICISATDYGGNAAWQSQTGEEDKLCSVVVTLADVQNAPKETKTPQEESEEVETKVKSTQETPNSEPGQEGNNNEKLNSAVSNANEANEFYPIVIAISSTVLIVVILVVLLVIYLRRKKSKQSNSEIPLPLRNVNRPRGDDKAMTMVMSKYGHEQPQTQVVMPLISQNGDYYDISGRQNCTSYPGLTRNGTANQTESMGRNSNSGGSVISQGAQCNTDRCCSRCSNGHYSATVEEVRNRSLTKSTPYNAAMTNSDFRAPLNSREHEMEYRRPGSSSLSNENYAESSFQESNSTPMGVHPMLSSTTTVNQYHHGSIVTTAAKPQTTFAYPLANAATVSMNGNRPRTSPVRQQQIAVQYAPTKRMQYADTSNLQYTDDFYNVNHLMENQVNRPFVKTLAV